MKTSTGTTDYSQGILELLFRKAMSSSLERFQRLFGQMYSNMEAILEMAFGVAIARLLEELLLFAAVRRL